MIKPDEDVRVRRYALDFKGPTLVVEYETSAAKIFVRKIRFRRYPADADPEKVARRLMKQFGDILGAECVQREQVYELVALLLSSTPMAKGGKKFFDDDDTAAAAAASAAPAPAPSNTDELSAEQLEEERIKDLNLNTASEAVNQRAKKVMDVTFAAHALKPGDEGYEYDKVVEFEEPDEDNDWDEDSD